MERYYDIAVKRKLTESAIIIVKKQIRHWSLTLEVMRGSGYTVDTLISFSLSPRASQEMRMQTVLCTIASSPRSKPGSYASSLWSGAPRAELECESRCLAVHIVSVCLSETLKCVSKEMS